MIRDRLFSVLVSGLVGGVLLSWACGPVIPDAKAQDGGAACESWDVRAFAWNEPTVEPLIIANGFEPFAYSLGAVVARKCAD